MRQNQSLVKNVGSILVATDLSVWGGNAVERAFLLAKAARSKLHILHVVPIGASKSHVLEAENALEKHVSKVLGKKKNPAGIHTQVAVGSAVAKIAETAKTNRVAIVVLGRHGERAVKDLFLGSTAQRVLRYGSTSVLMVNKGSVLPYRTIVSGVDFFKSSFEAIAQGIRFMGADAKRLVLTHVCAIPPIALRRAGMSESDFKKLKQEIRNEAEDKLKALTKQHIKIRSGIRSSFVVEFGDPRSFLLSQSKKEKADLLVLGAHSRPALARVLLGSVSEYVAERSNCDVFLYRP